MSLLPILHYPDDRLHTVAQPVKVVDDDIRKLIDDMAETMYEANGVGLAATQVNVHYRVVVIDISETRDQLLALVNPEIFDPSGQCDSEEGCLSIPGIYDKVSRAEKVRVRALDRNAQSFELELDGLISRCIQHEVDHLNGKLFIEHLSRLKLNRIKARLVKQARITA